MPKTDYSTTEVAKIVGLKYQTLDRWLAEGALTCDVPAEGTGSRRRFTFRDIVYVMFMMHMRRQDMPVPMITAITDVIREVWIDDDPAGAGYLLLAVRGEKTTGIYLLDPAEIGRRLGSMLQNESSSEIVWLTVNIVKLARMAQDQIAAFTAARKR